MVNIDFKVGIAIDLILQPEELRFESKLLLQELAQLTSL